MLDLASYMEEVKKENKDVKWVLTNGHGAKVVKKEKQGLMDAMKSLNDKDLRTNKVCY